jgi:hypothetical protein
VARALEIIRRAKEAHISTRFHWGLSYDRFMGEIRNSMTCALKSGIITAAEAQRVNENAPQWFSPLKDRGFKDGDRLTYDIGVDKTRTVYMDSDGKILVDLLEQGEVPHRSVLGNYFAPCSDFREDLLRSLFE